MDVYTTEEVKHIEDSFLCSLKQTQILETNWAFGNHSSMCESRITLVLIWREKTFRD